MSGQRPQRGWWTVSERTAYTRNDVERPVVVDYGDGHLERLQSEVLVENVRSTHQSSVFLPEQEAELTS